VADIPSYMVWDLTAEAKIYKDYVSLVGGVKNLLDEDYYTRVRGGRIDPSYERNYYAGFRIEY
jgi:Fe(3+) dicitrate transport protein